MNGNNHNQAQIRFKGLMKIVLVLLFVIPISSLIFDSKGSIVLTLLWSFWLLFSLPNIGIKPQSFQNIASLPNTATIVSHWGPLILYHSHHSPTLRRTRKEFRIGKAEDS